MRKINKKLKHQKTNLSFQCSKVMKYLRTPKDIWADLIKEFNFTVDCCASDQNHLLPKYYTIKDDCLTKDWSGEIAYIHPLFDGKIGKYALAVWKKYDHERPDYKTYVKRMKKRERIEKELQKIKIEKLEPIDVEQN